MTVNAIKSKLNLSTDPSDGKQRKSQGRLGASSTSHQGAKQVQEDTAANLEGSCGGQQEGVGSGKQPILIPEILTTNWDAVAKIVMSCLTDFVLWRAS